MASYQEKFYSSDPDCIKAGQQLTKFTFFETYLISWHTNELTLPKEIMQIPKSTIKVFKKPYCDSIDLPFNMGTYDHFDVKYYYFNTPSFFIYYSFNKVNI